MKVKFLLSTVLVLAFTLAACAPQAAPTKKAAAPTAVPPVTKLTTVPTKTGSTSSTTTSNTTRPTTVPTKAPASTSSLSTPAPALINDLSVDDQSVTSGTVLISMVDALKPGWVAIFTDDNGQPGKLLGYVAVPSGTSEDIKVTVDPKSVPPKMIAMLLVDAGKIGTFEYPGPDEPVKNANVSTNVMAIFNRVGASQ